ncbi:MAG: peptide deformylase [Pikeienuella sp.]
MSDRFLIWPDRRLSARATPVERIGEAERALWERMLTAMYAMPGVGLAAPQIGVPLRLAVVDCAETGRAPIRLANPELVEISTETREHEEASPNLPGVSARIARPASVLVRYLDETGESRERRFDGLWATSDQHQIDHLDGKLYFHRLGPVKRRMLLDRHAKLRRRG